MPLPFPAAPAATLAAPCGGDPAAVGATVGVAAQRPGRDRGGAP